MSTGFGLDNLPWGVARGIGAVTRLGDDVVELAPLFPDLPFTEPSLNAFGALGRPVWEATRTRLRELVEGAPRIPLSDVEMELPVEVADYVDFYSSELHATNAGRIFRPKGDPLFPNWRHLPVGYHGRAGTVVASGTPVARPSGQLREGVFGPTERLDVEVELGFVVGAPSSYGHPVAADDVLDHVLGVVLLNDWSARDIQGWETQPLGPMLGKSFCTSISPWVVPLDALPRVAEGSRGACLPHLATTEPWGLDVVLELEVDGQVVSTPRARDLHWSAAQQMAHLTSNGSGLRAGDLWGSGTVSSPEGVGSLLELTWNAGPWLADGQVVTIRGSAGGVSLGEVVGEVRPAR